MLFNTMSHIYQASNYTLPLQIRMLSQGKLARRVMVAITGTQVVMEVMIMNLKKE